MSIEGSAHVDIYGISLNDSSEAPLSAFLAIFRVLFGSRGVNLQRPVVTCDHESGERAARTVWMLAVLGYTKVRNYVAAWGEWGSRDDSQIAVPQ